MERRESTRIIKIMITIEKNMYRSSACYNKNLGLDPHNIPYWANLVEVITFCFIWEEVVKRSNFNYLFLRFQPTGYCSHFGTVASVQLVRVDLLILLYHWLHLEVTFETPNREWMREHIYRNKLVNSSLLSTPSSLIRHRYHFEAVCLEKIVKIQAISIF